MKRCAIWLLPLVFIPALGLLTSRVITRQRLTATSQAAVLEPVGRNATRRGKSVKKRKPSAAETEAPAPGEAAPGSDEVRRRLKQNERGTYIAEILLQRDSALVRWPERTLDPLRVWVGTGEALDGWESAYVERVLDAFGEWSELGIPMRFTFVVDSADADVHVNWIDHFREPISGKTLWARDKRWWIVSGSITLALRHNAGEPLDDRSIKAIALHEIGHLLGLDHTADSSNIMTSRVRVRELSDADRATMRLLYTLPPGSIKE